MHRAHQVHIDDEPEIVQAHLREASVPQNAGVVHQQIDPTPGAHGLLCHVDHRGRVGHRAGMCQRLSAGRDDLVDHRLRGRGARAQTIDGAAQVVDHDLGSARRQRQRMLATQPTPRPGHEGHPAVKA